MPEKTLIFKSLKYNDILEPEFSSFEENGRNTLDFKMLQSGGMVVVYAPNGTGKTTLSNLLGSEKTTRNIDFEASFEGRTIRPENQEFHIIGDQSTRNIIRGNTSDYLIGVDIQREYELREQIEGIFADAFTRFSKKLKDAYSITKADNYFLALIDNPEISRFIKIIIPTRNQRATIDRIEFIRFIRGIQVAALPETVDDEKVQFIIKELELVQKVLGLTAEIGSNESILELEQNKDAISVLKKYHNHTSCVVCDNANIVPDLLLSRKRANRERVYDSLSPEIKRVLDEIVNNSVLDKSDPFMVKNKVAGFISTGSYDELQALQMELTEYTKIVAKEVTNEFLNMFSDTSLDAIFDEYATLLESRPELDEEELMLIKEIVNENIGPELTIERDTQNGRNFRLFLDGKAFLGDDLGKNAKQLALSTGERNFISLAFELLLARHSDKDFVVLDDPISSFDSVYKNKIAYCIIKFLETKKNIILTHNLDLVRLLEFQNSGCFNLYMYNNTEGGVNGFSRVNNTEKKILINLHDLIKFLRGADATAPLENVVLDKRGFLMAMIPFIRGYAHILCTEDDIYSGLSSIMHGYETGSVEISQIYKRLFGYDFGEECIVSVDDIINVDTANISTVDTEQLPLLAETLKQTLIYYHLRVKVEKTLTTLYPSSRRTGEDAMLGQIIRRAFQSRRTDPDVRQKTEYRVFFTSRKTLLNEFNHFEGNMNIFQPAIDIEDFALQREVNAIYEKLALLEREYAD